MTRRTVHVAPLDSYQFANRSHRLSTSLLDVNSGRELNGLNRLDPEVSQRFTTITQLFSCECVENFDFLEEFSMRGYLAAPTGTLDFPLRNRQLMERLAI